MRKCDPSGPELLPLYARSQDVWGLALGFLDEASRDLRSGRRLRFTRRALSDLRQWVERERIEDEAPLRDLVLRILREGLEAGGLPDRIPSEMLHDHLETTGAAPDALPALQAQRDLEELDQGLPKLVDRSLLQSLAEVHGVSQDVLTSFCSIVDTLSQDEEGNQLSYSQLVDRTRQMSRLALWLVSGAHSQVEFRRFFGDKRWQMPNKSVAWAIFHEVFPEKEDVQ